MTCTSRKSIVADPRMRVGSVAPGRTIDRVDEWLDRLRTTAPQRSVGELYAGEHWVVCKSIFSGDYGEFKVCPWVISAGYGLIRPRDQVASYDASFHSSGENSVVPAQRGSSSAPEAWWRGLASWAGPEPGQPRSLVALVLSDPGAVTVVACSSTYLRAVKDDIRHASTRTQNFFLVAPSESASEFRDYLVPVDSRAKTLLGGSMISLNARVVRHVLETAKTHNFDRSKVARTMEDVLEGGVVERFNRESVSDGEVVAFIEHALWNGDPRPTSKTALLRRFRDGGRACEQKRFGMLYAKVAEAEPDQFAEGKAIK